MLNKKLKKAVASVTMFATVFSLSGLSLLAPLFTANAATIVDGDIVKSNATNSDGTPAISSLDVYIVKTVGTKKFKRLVLNPNIFASYGHLKWSNLKTVSQAEIDAYTTSSLVRVDGNDKVYAITPVVGGDTGAKSWINVTAAQFLSISQSDPDSIYTINSTDGAAYSAKADITTVAQLQAFYADGTLPAPVAEGDLKVALAAGTPEAANIPNGVGVDFLKFNLTASSKADVVVNSITLTAGGLGDPQKIDSVALYDEDGDRINATLKDVNSDKEVSLNVSGFTVKAGTTETVSVRAQIESAVTNIFSLGIKEASDIASNATAVTGSFPVNGNSLSSVTATGLATLTVADDGTPADVNLGDEAATIAKFKITNGNVEDSTVTKISLKRDSSIANSAADDDFENLALYSGSAKIATASEITNKYVTFNISSGLLIGKNITKKFTVKADVIDGAGKDIKIILDNLIDITAAGSVYPSILAGSFAGSTIDINAGAVTIEKVNAPALKVKPDTDNVELGTFKITANSGQEVQLSSLSMNIVTTNDNEAAASAFTQIENVEVYDKTDGIVYDLTYVSGTATKVYANTNIDIDMASGETHELVVRADTKSTATVENYTVGISDAATQVVIKETVNDTVLGDITPNAVTLSKVTVEEAGVTLSLNPLTAAKTAVVGTSGVEAINLNIEASEASALKVTELKFIETIAPATFNSTLVSGFALYVDGSATPVKTVGTSALAAGEITFSDLDIAVAAGDTVKVSVTLDLVNDSSNTDTMKLRLSGYSIEEDTETSSDSIYDATAENVLANGVIAAGETGATSLLSARTITAVGVGSLAVSTDNSLDSTKNDTYAVAGTTTGVLAAVKLVATNEDVEVTKMVLNTTGYVAGATAAEVFSGFALYDSPTSTTPVVSSTGNITANVTFDNFTYKVATGGEKYLYLKATLNNIGQDKVGKLNQTALLFQFNGIEANGASSQTDLAETPTGNTANATPDAGEIFYESADATTITVVSKKLGVLASRISNVSLVSSGDGYTVNSTLSSGEQIIAILQVTADASSNTTATGSAVKTALKQVNIDINKLTDAGAGVGTAITAATIQNSDSSTTTAAAAGIVSTANGQLDFASLTGSDYEIVPGETEYFLIKATVTKGTGDDYVQAKLTALDAAVEDINTQNFTWVDTTLAADKSNMRLGVSSISGPTLSE